MNDNVKTHFVYGIVGAAVSGLAISTIIWIFGAGQVVQDVNANKKWITMTGPKIEKIITLEAESRTLQRDIKELKATLKEIDAKQNRMLELMLKQ